MDDKIARMAEVLNKRHLELYQQSIEQLNTNSRATNLYNRGHDLYKKITNRMDHLYDTALDIIVTKDDMTVNLPDHCLWKIVGVNDQKRYGIFIQRLMEVMYQRISNMSAEKRLSMIDLEWFDPFPLENGLYDEKIINTPFFDYIWSDTLLRYIDNLAKIYDKLCQMEYEASHDNNNAMKVFHFWMGKDGTCYYQEITSPIPFPNDDESKYSMEKTVSSFDNKKPDKE